MKHLKLFFALFAMLALGVGNAWGAETDTYDFKTNGVTKVSGPNAGNVTSSSESVVLKSKTGNTTDTWTIIFTGSTAYGYGKSTGIYFGTNSYAPNAQMTSKSYDYVSQVDIVTTTSNTSYEIGVKVGGSSFGEKTLGSCTSQTQTFTSDATTGAITISITSSNKKQVKIEKVIITYGSASATPDPVDPTVTFSNGSYTVGQTLDLSSLWTSNSTGEVTYTVANAGTTGASISGSLFTATAAGTCTVKASQAATSAYNAIEKTATITVTAPTPATVTLSEAGQEKTVEGKYVGDSYELPLTSTQTCGTKTFVGWSTVEIATPGDKPTSNFYEPGTTVTLAAEQTFYAVYATEGEGEGNVFDGTTGGTFKIYAQVGEDKKYLAGTGSKITPVDEAEATEYTFTKINDGIFSIKTEDTYITYVSSTNLGTSNDAYEWKINAGTKGSWRIESNTTSGRGIVYRAGTTNKFGGYATSNVSENGTEYYDVEIGSGSSTTYSDYTTACEQETPATDLTDEQLKWSAATATALKGAAENAFPELTNSLEVDVTYTSSNASVATIAADGSITLVAPGTTTISAIFAGGEVSGTKYAAKTVTYTLTVKQLVSCADIYNLADEATFVLKDFVVTYVNDKYTYIKDDTGYGLIYKESYGLNAGDQVASGKLEGKRDSYNGLVEIIPTTEVGDLGATSGTAPDPEVMNTNPTEDDMNKYVKFENVSFKYTNLNDTYKTNSGKLEGQTEYNIAFYNKFTSNVTFDTSKKYDVVGVVSIKGDAIEVYFISAEEVAEPTLNVKITNADFGKIAINDDAERTLTLNGSLLTNTVSLAIEGEDAEHFKLASESVTPTDGNITDANIKITYKPTAEGTHTATLKITSDELAEQTITLTGQAVQQHTVHFFVNGEEQTELAKKVLFGNTLEELPTATSCDLLNYPTFAGWTSAEIDGTTDVKPTMLDLSTPITSDCNYYAVFEKATVGGSSEEQTETITIENFKLSGDGEKRTCETNSATWTWVKNSGSAIVVTYEEIRLYQNHSMTISKKEGCDISKILATVSESKYAEPFAGELSGAEKTTDGNNITLTPTSGDIVITQSNQSRVNSFVVTYTTSTTTYEYITSCAVVVPTCEITYDYADGEGECTNDIVEEGAEYTLCSTAPTKAGHTFLNWKDQHDTEYAAGATIISVTEDLTLTAQWQVNSYSVTWISLGDEVLVNSADYNTQPTKPATDPTYTCSIGTKEFVGWTTQEIDGIGVPANLYTDEFPVVTEAITYHAVFASKIEGGSIAKAVSLTNGETVYLATESGIGVTGANTSTNKDATVSTTQGDWLPFTVITNGLQYQFKNGDNYITAAAKSFKITEIPSDFAFENGYIVYNVPSGSNAGDYVLLVNNNDAINTYYRFYKESNMSNSKYETFYVYKNPTHTDYTTSCPVLDLTEGENTLTDGVTADVKVNRLFTTGNLYTISLPFALDAAQVNDIFGTGTALYQFAQLAKEGEELVLYFSKPSAIAAATPYLIKPTQDVAAGFIVEDAVISTTPNNISFTVGATTITMKPILSAADGAKTNGSTEYWLAADTWLYNNANTLLSLRALFDITTISGMPPRCRVALDENVETGVEDIITTDAPVKVIENEQLIIIRDGVKYNLQGQKL